MTIPENCEGATPIRGTEYHSELNVIETTQSRLAHLLISHQVLTPPKRYETSTREPLSKSPAETRCKFRVRRCRTLAKFTISLNRSQVHHPKCAATSISHLVNRYEIEAPVALVMTASKNQARHPSPLTMNEYETDTPTESSWGVLNLNPKNRCDNVASLS